MSDPMTLLAIERKREALRLQAWARSCLGKWKYADSSAAAAGARRAKRRRKVQLYTYFCHHCCGYHLTSRPQQ